MQKAKLVRFYFLFGTGSSVAASLASLLSRDEEQQLEQRHKDDKLIHDETKQENETSFFSTPLPPEAASTPSNR